MAIPTHRHKCPRCRTKYDRPMRQCAHRGETILCYECAAAGYVIFNSDTGQVICHLSDPKALQAKGKPFLERWIASLVELLYPPFFFDRVKDNKVA